MLIKGGHIVDPVTGTDEILDIRIGQDRKDPEEKAAAVGQGRILDIA